MNSVGHQRDVNWQGNLALCRQVSGSQGPFELRLCGIGMGSDELRRSVNLGLKNGMQHRAVSVAALCQAVRCQLHNFRGVPTPWHTHSVAYPFCGLPILWHTHSVAYPLELWHTHSVAYPLKRFVVQLETEIVPLFPAPQGSHT